MPGKYKTILIRKNAKLAAKRGIKRFRIIKQGNELLRVAVTKKSGLRGGHTIIVSKLKRIKNN